MAVTIDDLPLATNDLGLSTIGDVLSHVGRENKLVVQILIDGTEPDMRALDAVRGRRLDDCVLYVETARPAQVACEVLDAVDQGLEEAEAFRLESAELFRSGDPAVALQKLAGCFSYWHNAQDSVGKIAKLLRVDLEAARTDANRPVKDIIETFAVQLRQLRDALESRDYVLCCDVLTYDMEGITPDWRAATSTLRRIANGR